MFEVKIRTGFSAAHHLDGYRGRCESVHGHNWDVEVSVRGESLDRVGMLMDFRLLRREVDAVLSGMDHADLNRVAALGGRNPTSEHIAACLYAALSKRINRRARRVGSVTVFETGRASATYWEEPSMSSPAGVRPAGPESKTKAPSRRVVPSAKRRARHPGHD